MEGYILRDSPRHAQPTSRRNLTRFDVSGEGPRVPYWPADSAWERHEYRYKHDRTHSTMHVDGTASPSIVHAGLCCFAIMELHSKTLRYIHLHLRGWQSRIDLGEPADRKQKRDSTFCEFSFATCIRSADEIEDLEGEVGKRKKKRYSHICRLCISSLEWKHFHNVL